MSLDVTLTDDERIALIDAATPFADGGFDEQEFVDGIVIPAVERILADRLAQVTAELDIVRGAAVSALIVTGRHNVDSSERSMSYWINCRRAALPPTGEPT